MFDTIFVRFQVFFIYKRCSESVNWAKGRIGKANGMGQSNANEFNDIK